MKSMLATLLCLAVFTSAQAQDPKGLPDNVRKELGRLVGTWKGEVNAGDQKVTATLTARWTKSKDALIWHWESPLISTTNDAGSFTVKGTGLLGWDAHAKQLKELSFNNLSETINRGYKITGEGKWEGEQTGTYRTDDMTKHVPMKGKVSITFSGDTFDFKESADYAGDLFRDVSLTMRREKK